VLTVAASPWILAPAPALASAAAAQPAPAPEAVPFRLAFAEGQAIRYQLQFHYGTHDERTYSDGSVEVSNQDLTVDQTIRYDIGAVQPDGSAAVTVTLEKVSRNLDGAVQSAENAAVLQATMLPTGGMRDLQVITGIPQDPDRLGLGAMAFGYPDHPVELMAPEARPFPVQLTVSGLERPVSAESATTLTELGPETAAFTQLLAAEDSFQPSEGVLTRVQANGSADHAVDRATAWPRTGKATASMTLVVDTSGAAEQAGEDAPQPQVVLDSGVIQADLTYTRL
jgi:hypothetical protein